MHLASPAAALWCSCPPSVRPYLTFILLSVLPSFPPSIHLFSSSGGEALRLAVRSPLPPTMLCEGESYEVFERDSALHWGVACYLFPVRGLRSLRSSLKVLRSARRHRCTTDDGRQRRGSTLGRTCDKTPCAPHVHSFSFEILPVQRQPPVPAGALLPPERKWNNMKRTLSTEVRFPPSYSPYLPHTFSSSGTWTRTKYERK